MLLITGATGHSGEWFIKMLISDKYDKRIRCTVRETSNTSYLDNSGLDIELVIGDLKDPVFANRARLLVQDVRFTTKLWHLRRLINYLRILRGELLYASAGGCFSYVEIALCSDAHTVWANELTYLSPSSAEFSYDFEVTPSENPDLVICAVSQVEPALFYVGR